MRDTNTFHEKGRALVLRLLAVAALALAVATASVASEHGAGAAVLGAGFAAASVFFLLLARQKVVLGSEDVVLVYAHRSRRIPLRDIEGFGIRKVRNFTGERIARPTLTAAGAIVVLPGLQPFRLLRSTDDDYPLLSPLARQAGFRVVAHDV